tara:strand:+ start:32 stop:145 length:114 start_codon:yes stop_codon:yes gene_type:complete
MVVFIRALVSKPVTKGSQVESIEEARKKKLIDSIDFF